MKGLLRSFYVQFVQRQLKIIWLLAIMNICIRLISHLDIDENQITTISNSLISSLGIIIAVVTTFIFTKIFGERAEKIERKQLIDGFSLKVNAVRKLGYQLSHRAEFWRNESTYDLRTQYPDLTFFDLLEKKYDDYNQILGRTKLSELTLQAYLGAIWLRGEDGFPTEILQPTFRKNYSIKELIEYNEACNAIRAYLEEHHGDIDFSSTNQYWKNLLLSDLKKIDTGYSEVTPKNISRALDYISAYIIPKMIDLTQRNIESQSTSSVGLYIDLMLSCLLIVVSILCQSMTFSSQMGIHISVVLISTFITILIDIIFNTIRISLKILKVSEFYA